LDFFSEEEIDNNFHKGQYYKKNDKFIIYETIRGKFNHFKTYDALQIVLKRNDKNLVISSIGGNIIYKNKINDCYKKQNEIDVEFRISFKELQRKEWGISKTYADKNGTYKPITYDFKNSNRIMIACYDWSSETGWTDNLKISIYTKEYRDFINEQK